MLNQVQTSRHIEVLLADDSDDDVELTRRGFAQGRFLVNLHRVRDGVECLEFLRNEGKYSDVPKPDMLLLDMNMPRLGGREVLQAIASDERFTSLPVVVLASSEEEVETLAMYQLGCSSYIIKPIDTDQFLRTVRGITEYWFAIVVLPKAH
jgi:chemotaxis family two-component system response regulator Rcp1